MTRHVVCKKLNAHLPGLPFPPFRDALGMKIYNEISAEAWKQWISLSTMLINENRLNPSEPKSKEFLKEKMIAFLFEGSAERPSGYVPPTNAST